MKFTAIVFCSCALLASSVTAQWSKDPALNTRLSDGAGDEIQAKIRGGADGHAYVSWFDSDPAGSPAFGYDVKLQRLDPAGNELWASGGVTIADRGFSSTQDYGMDAGPNGDAFLVFRDDRFGGVVITVTRVDADGNQVWGPTGIQLTAGGGFVASPRIAATSDGACVVAWVEGNTSRIQRVAADGTLLWGAGIAIPVAAGETANISDVRAVESGRVIFSWVSQTGGFFGPRRLRAGKLEDNGTSLWGSGVNFFSSGSLQIANFPIFEPDGTGGAIFSWYTTALQCFVQRVDATGTISFAAGGVPVSTNATRERVSPHAVYRAATQETYVFWTELAAAQSQRGLYGQRLDASGTRQWTNDGIGFVPVSASQDVGFARAALTGATTTAAWFENSGFGTDVVRSLGVDSSGTLQQPISTISSPPSSKGDLAIDVGPFGSVRAAWHDNRTGDNDVYAQNVRMDGGVGPAAGSLVRTAGTNVSSLTVDVDPLGGQLAFEIDLSTTGHLFGFLFLYVAPDEVPVGNGDVLLVDIFSSTNLLKAGLKVGPLIQLSPNTPNDPSLCGVALFSQAWHIDTVLDPRLSNAVDIYLGL